MKIKKESLHDIYYWKKEFEVSNNDNLGGFYIFEYEGEKHKFYLQTIDSANIDERYKFLELLDELFERHNGLTTKENLDNKTYEWVKNNEDYFKKTNAVVIYRWFEIFDDRIMNWEVEE